MSATERRSKERISSAQAATLFLESGVSHACTITDFCDQGMFITFGSGAIPSDSSVRILRVSFANDQGKELFVNAEPAHVEAHSAGIRFVKDYPDAISYLRTRYSGQASVTLSSQHKALVEQCLVQIEKVAQSTYRDLFPKMLAAFREEAIASSTDQLANTRMSVCERIEKYESAILSKASNELLKIKPLNANPNASNESANLNIIEKGEFEDWLICKVVTTKLEQQFRTPLLMLKMRTDAMGHKSDGGSGSPLGPERIVYAFHAALYPYLDDLTLEKSAFKLLGVELSTRLEALIDSLNESLADAGVLPNASLGSLAKAAPPKPEKPKEKPHETESAQEKESKPNTSEESSTPRAIDKVESNRADSPVGGDLPIAHRHLSSQGYGGQALNHQGIDQGNLSALDLPQEEQEDTGSASGAGMQSGYAGGASNAGSVNQGFSVVGKLLRKMREHSAQEVADENLPRFTPQEVDTGLSALHGQTRQLDSDDQQSTLLERILASLNAHSSAPRALDDDQKDQIDVVDRFFGSLKQNPRLTNEGKQHLFRLEIPVLRQLLENDGFFDDQDSPLRDVLNRIAKLGASGGRLGKIGHQKIEQLVERINNEFDQNHYVVNEVRKELDDLQARQYSLYVKNVERVAAAADGAHRVEEAKKEVFETVSKMLRDQKIPLALQSLIDNGWLDHLNLMSIKFGKSSTEYQDALAVVRDLKDFGQDPSKGFDTRRNVPLIQEGLKSASGGLEASKQIREQLKQLVLDAPNNEHEMVEAKPLPKAESSIDKDREQLNIEKSRLLRPWIIRAKAIPLNAWMRFQKTPDGEPQFIRLVWIARAYTKFVFVNHQGLKVIELGLFRLAEYLKTGQIEPDPSFNEPIIKQGLDDMVKEVYEKLAFDSSHDKETGLPNEQEFLRSVTLSMQRGERTQQCCLYYLRALTDEIGGEAEGELIEGLTELVKPYESKSCAIGRLNRYDFGVFVFDSNTLHVTSELSSSLDQVLNELRAKYPNVAVMRSEVWGYLGFNNTKALVSNARDSLKQIEDKEDDSSGDSVRVDLAQPDELDSKAMLPFSRSDADAFDVSSQIVKKTSESELPDNECLRNILSVEDGDEFYRPNTLGEAYEANAWWLGFATRKLSGHASLVVYRVPISAVAVLDDAFKDEVTALLECTNLSPESVWFDLYDCNLIDNEHLAADIIRELQVIGFHFSIQGYGTYECPANLLQMLPVDLIVIESDVLKEFEDEADDEPLVRVAHHFGKGVLVQNVDSAIMLQKVEKQGVDFVQGERIGGFQPF